MKYAIISDVHGNYHAFIAVLADAKAQGADMYLLLGDYASSFPYGNDVTEVIRCLDNAVVIRGNGEGYFVNLQGRNPEELTHEQFKLVYWAYRSLSRENLEYLVNLPETAVVMNGDSKIHLAHAMGLFYRTPEIKHFHSQHFRTLMEEATFTHEEYLARAREELLARPEAAEEILAMPKGVYLFGHNHLQFHTEYEERLFINPGSCGAPLEWDTRAPYTLLTIDGADWVVTERRVVYDLQLAAEGLKSSGFHAYTPAWSDIMELELTTGKDYFSPFVMHIQETAHKMGETKNPVSNGAWEEAVKTWRM